VRGQLEGVVGGHHFSIIIPDAKLVAQTPARSTWRLASGEATVSDDGPPTADSKFVIARSPRTLVRSDAEAGVIVVTELAREHAGRVITCVYSETVDDPESPRAKAARNHGLAACQSLRVDPR